MEEIPGKLGLLLSREGEVLTEYVKKKHLLNACFISVFTKR